MMRVSATLLGALWCCIASAQPPVAWLSCASCHGADGRGEPSKGAPNLTGLSEAYLRKQFEAFAAGVRGGHEDDPFAQQMALMAPIYTERVEDLQAVINQTLSLPHRPSPETPQGDPGRGAAAYESCSACHGSRGEGNDTLAAPRLKGMSGWYLVRRYAWFESTGGGSADPAVVSMAASARANPLDDQTLADIAAHLATFFEHRE